ncbi:MAG TPA: hypothetical protein VIL20_12290 [Sandaracinaceae bacterium]
MRALLCLVAGVSFAACGGTIRSERIRHAADADRCARMPAAARARPSEPGAEERSVPPDAPPEVVRVARAAGLEEALDPGWLDDVANRQRVLERVFLLQAEVGAAANEIGCLDDQIEDVQQELVEREDAAELGFTLGSIALGALAGVAAGIAEIAWPDTAIAPAIGIAGGIATGALGALAFFPPSHSVELRHRRNVLAAVDGSADILPRFVVRLLNAPRAGQPSGTEALRARWEAILDELSDDPDERLRLRETFFGSSGVYDLAALRARETMLEALETEIDLQTQDLELFFRYLFPRRSSAPEAP